MGVAKAALETSVKYLAPTSAPRAFASTPSRAGPIKTLAASGIGDFRYIMKWNEYNSPLRRNVTIEDVGGAGLYLLSDLASRRHRRNPPCRCRLQCRRHEGRGRARHRDGLIVPDKVAPHRSAFTGGCRASSSASGRSTSASALGVSRLGAQLPGRLGRGASRAATKRPVDARWSKRMRRGPVAGACRATSIGRGCRAGRRSSRLLYSSPASSRRTDPAPGSCRRAPARCSNQRHRAADQFLDAADIFDRLRRQVGPAARAARSCPAQPSISS